MDYERDPNTDEVFTVAKEQERLQGALNEVETHLISIADGVRPAEAVAAAFNAINSVRKGSE